MALDVFLFSIRYQLEVLPVEDSWLKPYISPVCLQAKFRDTKCEAFCVWFRVIDIAREILS
jgi:hypothetical protein